MRDTNKVTIIALAEGIEDFLDALQTSLRGAGLGVSLISLETFQLGELTRQRLRDVRSQIIRAKEHSFVIYVPNSTELHLTEPDFTFAFSAYRSWHRAERNKVIPHLWTPIRPPPRPDWPIWKSKPPPMVGFMGRSHGTSRLAQIVACFPRTLKRALLRGDYLRYPALIAGLNSVGLKTQNINTFPRMETLSALSMNSRDVAQINITQRKSFGGGRYELEEYIGHLIANTYIVCPRGSENYSFRMYETLCYGRVPVILDTDIVLPQEVDWSKLAIIVPYQEVGRTLEHILEDYSSKSETAFLERQELAFSTMSKLAELDWVNTWARGFSLSRKLSVQS